MFLRAHHEVGPKQETGMSKPIIRGGGLTMGLDLGDRWTEGRVLDASGEVIESFRVRTTEPAMDVRMSSYDPCRVVLEVGTHSPWVAGSSEVRESPLSAGHHRFPEFTIHPPRRCLTRPSGGLTHAPLQPCGRLLATAPGSPALAVSAWACR